VELLPQLIAWCIALAWVYRSLAAWRGMPTLPNLLLPAYDMEPAGEPSITVIVPARNEQQDILACLESLLAQDYAHLSIIAVNDRSTDATGPIMDALACDRLRVLHVTDLPPQWLGKTHAMASAVALADSDYLLFTDADVLFRRDAIRRALVCAVVGRADHMVLGPTTLIHSWDEAALLAFFQIFGLWAVRPWKIADPKALRDSIGVGAFNLLRTSAYRQVGGFEALRMEIVEDLGLGRRIKQAGLAQRVAFGRGLVSLHWATGAEGIVNVITKNIFSAFRFHISLVLVACGWLIFFCILPFIAVWSRPFTAPALLTIAAIGLAYYAMRRGAGLSAWNALLAPLAASLLIYALVRSTVLTLWQGGVIWRGTFYPLSELRKHAMPVMPRRPSMRD
jgi:glycosyltransferase involved in cell wall biosynthesis